MGTLRDDQYTFQIIYPSVLLRMINISGKSCGETRNKHFMLNNLFFENRAMYETMWKNVVEHRISQITIRCLRIACWVLKSTNTHTHTQTV